MVKQNGSLVPSHPCASCQSLSPRIADALGLSFRSCPSSQKSTSVVASHSSSLRLSFWSLTLSSPAFPFSFSVHKVRRQHSLPPSQVFPPPPSSIPPTSTLPRPPPTQPLETLVETQHGVLLGLRSSRALEAGESGHAYVSELLMGYIEEKRKSGNPPVAVDAKLRLLEQVSSPGREIWGGGIERNGRADSGAVCGSTRDASRGGEFRFRSTRFVLGFSLSLSFVSIDSISVSDLSNFSLLIFDTTPDDPLHSRVCFSSATSAPSLLSLPSHHFALAHLRPLLRIPSLVINVQQTRLLPSMPPPQVFPSPDHHSTSTSNSNPTSTVNISPRVATSSRHSSFTDERWDLGAVSACVRGTHPKDLG